MRAKKLMLFIGGRQTEWPAIERALSELGIAGGVLYAERMDQALTYLHNREEPVPSVVLLTIDEGGSDGLEALKVLKADERIGRVPVVVLASSNDERLVNESFALGAAGYMLEPDDSREVAEAIRMIRNYWSLSELP